MDKIEDFGVHANSYYPLNIEIYKTGLEDKVLEVLWNKYWVMTLSQSPMLMVGEDAVRTILTAESSIFHRADP